MSETFSFSNASAFQIKHGTHEMLKKTVLENMANWQDESEVKTSWERHQSAPYLRLNKPGPAQVGTISKGQK